MIMFEFAPAIFLSFHQNKALARDTEAFIKIRLDGLEAKYFAEVFLFERLLSVLGISVSGSWAMPYGISLALMLRCKTD